MLRITELKLPLDHAPDALRPAVLARLGLQEGALRDITVVRRAWDARRKSAILLIYTLDCQLRDDTLEADVLRRFADDVHVRPAPHMRYVLVGSAPPYFAATQPLRPVVIGIGPCGMFAALVLAQMGLRPIVLERGKTVRERTKDTWGSWRQGQLNPDSNVQFGEGGAGTFSDGKLWSQISDPRHLTRKVLSEFVKAGAPEEILYVAKPHIGTFRLVSVVEHMRAEIEALGGEVRFQQQVVDVLIDDLDSSSADGRSRRIGGLRLSNGEVLHTEHVVLAVRTLRIAAPPQILAHELPPGLSTMRERHPGLRIIITSVTSGTAIEQLLNNEADVAVVGHMERLREESGKLLAVPMTTFPIVALLPPGHPLNSKKKLTLQDLVTQPLLLPPQRSSSRPQIDAAFSRHGLLAQMHVALEANVFHVVLPYVTLGFGTAILGASRNYIEGELRNRARNGEIGLKDVSHLFGDEKVFFLTRRTRVKQPHIEDLCHLLCHRSK